MSRSPIARPMPLSKNNQYISFRQVKRGGIPIRTSDQDKQLVLRSGLLPGRGIGFFRRHGVSIGTGSNKQAERSGSGKTARESGALVSHGRGGGQEVKLGFSLLWRNKSWGETESCKAEGGSRGPANSVSGLSLDDIITCTILSRQFVDIISSFSST